MSETDVPFSLTVVADTPPITATGACAVLTLDGVTYLIDPASGEELDPYHDPEGQFVQRNVVCSLPDMPDDFVAYYRPDLDSDREEWVFEFGDTFEAAPVNLVDAYTIDIIRADGTQVTVEAPEHFWLSRWRWQSEPRPVRRTPQELAHDKLLPHFDHSVLSPYSKTHAPQVYTPMTLAGITANQQQTGERPDIGIITDWQADYCCVGEGLGTLLAQGEVAGTFNVHVRADAFGPPMDLFEWPTASMYNHANSSPYIRRTACDVNGAKLVYDTQHSPALAYVPWLLTGDPYYLEELQFTANADVLAQPPSSRWRLNGRGLAWALRNCLYAWAATPEHVPNWLLPRSYWPKHLDEYRAYGFEKAAAEPENVLHTISSGGSQASPGWPGGSYASPWQEDFILAVFALCVRMGRSEWTAALIWKLDCTTARVHSDTWHQPNPSPYQISILYGCALAADCDETHTTIEVDQWGAIDPWDPVPFNVMLRDEPITVTARNGAIWSITRTKPKDHLKGHPITGRTFTSWAECYQRNLSAHPEIFPTNANDPEGQHLYTGKFSPYVSYARGGLALIVGEELPGAEPALEPYTWLDAEIIGAANSSYKLARKWCVVTGPASDTLSADLRLILFAVLRALAKLKRGPRT